MRIAQGTPDRFRPSAVARWFRDTLGPLARGVAVLACKVLVCIALFATAAPAETKPLPAAKPLTIIAFGDSTTALRENIKQVYAQRLADELPKRGLPAMLVNAGVGGNTTADAVARFDRDVIARHPDLVIVQFGLNDAAIDVWKNPHATTPRVRRDQYEKNLTALVQGLKQRKIRAILMTPNPMRWTVEMKKLYGKPPYDANDPDGFNLLVKDYAQTVRQIARRENVPLVDIYAIFNAWGSRKGHSVDELLSDGVHPNDAGHRIVAEQLIGKIEPMLK